MTAPRGLPAALDFRGGTVAGRVIKSPVELALFLREECGAEGYRIQGGMILALRWDLDGNEIVLDRFAMARAPS